MNGILKAAKEVSILAVLEAGQVVKDHFGRFSIWKEKGKRGDM